MRFWPFAPRQSRCFAVEIVHSSGEHWLVSEWHKIVVFKVPKLNSTIKSVIGPFRSELDCEEFIASVCRDDCGCDESEECDEADWLEDEDTET